MPLQFPCPECGHVWQAEEALAGKRMRCAKCKTILVVPGPGPAREAEPSPPGAELAVGRPVEKPEPRLFDRTAGQRRNGPGLPPRRRPPREGESQGAAKVVLIVALVGGGVLALLLLIGGVVLALLLSRPTADPVVNGPPPANTPRVQVQKHTAIPLADIGEFTAPTRGKAAATSLDVVSVKGDYIGAGRTYSYRGNQINLVTDARGVQVQVDGWRLEIGAPVGKRLEAGFYPNARRWSFSDNDPGIEFGGNGRGCNKIVGSFVVWEYETRDDQVIRAAIDFIQHCETVKRPPLTGKLRYNSTIE
jgi:hypothetical protein